MLASDIDIAHLNTINQTDLHSCQNIAFIDPHSNENQIRKYLLMSIFTKKLFLFFMKIGIVMSCNNIFITSV